jgi:hypothetical protein
MTKLESAPADPAPELTDASRTRIGGLDDDLKPLFTAESRPRLVSAAAILLAGSVLAALFEAIRIVPAYDIGVYQRGGWAIVLGTDLYPPTSPRATPRSPTLRSQVGCSLRSRRCPRDC